MTDYANAPAAAPNPPPAKPQRLARTATIAAVVLLTLIGWAYLIAAVVGGHDIGALGPGMSSIAPVLERIGVIVPAVALDHRGTAFGALDLAAVLAMWVAMVFAMMLPTAAPMLRAYAARGGAAMVGVGYVAIWLSVSVAATALQAGLVAAGALSPHMAPAGVALSASVLIAAGLYQFSPLKMACLVRCRNPHVYVSGARTPGKALRLGVEEGLACLGCCWAMMAVMIAAGLMNLVAMAFLGAIMALEKIVSGVTLTYTTGVILLVLGFGLASSLFFG